MEAPVNTSDQSNDAVVTGVGGSGMTRSLALGEQTVAAWSAR